MEYSIIYAVLRPEISEKISVGLIIVEGDKVDIKYSRSKLSGLKGYLSANQQKFVSRVVSSLKKKKAVNNVRDIKYLERYANNLISVSPLQKVDIAATEKNKQMLFKNYVYSGI